MTFIKNYSVFLTSFYSYKFLKYFAFVYAFYLLWMKQSGLDIFAISIILSLWSASVVILEIPSGILADHFSRKWMIIFACFINAIGIFIWYLIPNFWGFTFGFFCWGLEEAFCSGSEEALLFDTLTYFKKTDIYEKITATGHFINKTGLIIALLIGGILAVYDMKFTIIISAFCLALSAIPAFFLFEYRPFPLDKAEFEEHVKLLSILKIILKNKEMLQLFYYVVLVFTGIGVLEEYTQLYFEWKQIPLYFFGIGLTMVFIFQALGNWLAGILYRIKGKLLNIHVYSLLAAFFLLLSLVIKPIYISLFCFFLPFLFCCTAEIIVEGQYQRLITNSQRATFISLLNFSMNFSGIFMCLVFGFFNKLLDLKWGFLFFVFLLTLGSCCGLLKKPVTKNI